MLKIEGLNVSYNSERILNGIDLEIKAGETLAIIGESGAGKTTLGLSIMGLLNGNASGMIAFDGRDLLSLSKDEMRELRWNRIAMVFQNADNVLNPVYTVLDQVLEPMVEHRLKSREEAEQRASQLLAEVGLSSDKFNAYPHQISGGEQQRALVAMAWANEPELIILDEPLASLDAVSRLEVLALLKRMGRGRTMLVVTHDITAAANLAASIATMYGGRIVEKGATSEVLYNPSHPYTRALLRSYPGMATVKDLQGIKGRMTRGVPGCPFHPRCTQAIEVCQREVPLMVEHRERLVACHRGGIIPALSVKGMSKSFGLVKAVDNVSLVINGGETLALVGQSGSGKTTLAKAITGIINADAGDVYLEGKKVARQGKDFHRRVQMIFQKPGEALSHRLSVMEAVKEPLDIQGIGTETERINRVKKVIGEVELSTAPDFLEEYPHHLSGGELQRVTIARALVLDPQVLIADEPTSFLDSSVQAKILKLLLNLQERRGLSILFITHDIAVARKISDRMAIMLDGKIVEEGASSGIIASPSHLYTQNLLKAAQGNSKLG